MTMQDSRAGRLTRREALNLLGVGTGLGLLTGLPKDILAAESQARFTSAQTVTFPLGAIIRTILRDVPPEELAAGATLFHEHLIAGGNVEVLVDEVRAAGQDGLACVVDAATGRRTEQAVENLKQIATRSGVHIVMAGGYLEDLGFAPYPPHIAKMSEDQLVDEFYQDANARRWGAFGEIGTSLEMQPDERKVLRAISRTHLRTGLPIFTHTPHESCPKCAFEQLDIFEAQGVNPRHVCIGHLSAIKPEDDPRAETHKAIAKRGAFVGFDTVGHEMARSHIPEAQKVKMILAVLEAGFEDHLLLSSDMGNVNHLKANWGNGYASVLIQFVPKLRYAGVNDVTIRKILVDNPRRFLAFVPKKA